MAGAPRVATRYPGIYRRGDRYQFTYRDAHGKQRSQTERTVVAARREKARREDEARTGQSQDASLTLKAYADEWIGRYQGRTTRGFRESTRRAYRRELDDHVLPWFGERQKLATLTPRRVANFVAHLQQKPARGVNEALLERARKKARDAGEPEPPAPVPAKLSDASIKRIMAPLAACLATAVEEGVIPTNPTIGVRLPNRLRVEEEEGQHARALSDVELEALIQVAPERHRLLLVFLAATGLRISEANGLQWKHLVLSGAAPEVRIRRAYVKGEYGPPKSKHGSRSVPLPHALVLDLRRLKRETEFPGREDLVFGQPDGQPWETSYLRRLSIEPAAAEAGVSWAGFHTLRHTCATRLFAAGRNAVQVSRWLGHHSPAFTLETYVHLLNDDLGGPLDVPGAAGGSMGASSVPKADEATSAESA